MKKQYTLTVFFLWSFFVAFAQDGQPQIIPGEYIVTLKEAFITPLLLDFPDASDDRQARFQQTDRARQQKLTQLRQFRKGMGISDENTLFESVDAVVAFAAKLTDQQVRNLQMANNVEQVDNNFTFQLEAPIEEPNETENAVAQITPCAITNAGGMQDASGKLTYIWVMDTGIDLDHPDLNVVTDPAYAKSFITGETVEDGNGHGTHVAGIAAAKNNNIGMVGVSAGAKVVPIKVMSNAGGGSSLGVVSALNHIAQMYNYNDVVNMSFAAPGGNNCQNVNVAYRNAVRNLGIKGVWVCAAAGNDRCDASKVRPACINGTRIFTVGSMTCAKKCAATSNWSSAVVDWVATGEKVYSTHKNGTYKTLSGTSMATPVVAGICHSVAGPPVSAGIINCGNTCVPAANYNIAKR
jgi:subtilisin family serine protease